MGTREKVAPVFAVTCDKIRCFEEFTPARPIDRRSERAARRSARQEAGWQVRPPHGKGARTAPDYCPQHRDDLNGERTLGGGA